MGYRRFLRLTLLALLALLQPSLVAVTQDTPSNPDVACTVEPRSAEDLLNLWYDPAGTPVATPPSSVPLTETGALDVTLGEPADAATVEAVEAVAQEWVACTNAGDDRRAYALLTDDFAQRDGLQSVPRDEAQSIVSAQPAPRSPENRLAIGPAHHARMYPDGRIGAAFAVVGIEQPGIAKTVFMVFEQQDGQWRLDGRGQMTAFSPVAPVWGYDVVAEYPHDPDAYTQGLAFSNNDLYEGTGLYGESTLRRVDLETGEVLQSRALDDEYFGEGIAVFADRIYQLTWQVQVCFVYDRETFEVLETFTYPTEGWGLTSDGERLIMSDGTSRIVFRDPETFEALGSIDVQDSGLPVSNLNELEYIEGEIWANVYTTDRIVRIDPATGDVTGWINLAGLLPEDATSEPVDVLNGIAYHEESGRVFVTGKLWPTLFEIELIPPD